METNILTNCFISIDGETFTGKATNVSISQTAETQDITAMGDETRKNAGGLKAWSMTATFNADAAMIVRFHPLLGKTVPVEVRKMNEAISMINPAWVGDAVLTEFTPIDGAVGDKHTYAVSLVSAGDLGLLTTPPVA